MVVKRIDAGRELELGIGPDRLVVVLGVVILLVAVRVWVGILSV
jgi:hypothetical protein